MTSDIEHMQAEALRVSSGQAGRLLAEYGGHLRLMSYVHTFTLDTDEHTLDSGAWYPLTSDAIDLTPRLWQPNSTVLRVMASPKARVLDKVGITADLVDVSRQPELTANTTRDCFDRSLGSLVLFEGQTVNVDRYNYQNMAYILEEELQSLRTSDF